MSVGKGEPLGLDWINIADTTGSLMFTFPAIFSPPIRFRLAQ